MFRNNRIKFSMLICTLIVSIVYVTFMKSKTTKVFRPISKKIYNLEKNLFMFNTKSIRLQPSDALNDIYEQHYIHYRIAPFLPTYQNHRLILKLRTSSLAKYLYDNVDGFKGTIRHLNVRCLQKNIHQTMFKPCFNFTLNFNVKKYNTQQIHFSLNSITAIDPSLLVSTVPDNVGNDFTTDIVANVNRLFSADTVFRFTYQWLDLDIRNFFYWPQSTLEKSCTELILNDLIKTSTNDSQRQFTCSTTNILTHTTSKQLFTDERIAITNWLDAQYKSMITKSFPTEKLSSTLLSSITPKRRLSSFELISNATICTHELNRWISKYQDWHENISVRISDPTLTYEQQRDLIINENIRFLLYEKSPSGVADRMVHLISTYLIAILTNRLFVFDGDWPEFSHLMLSSLNYERESVIPWFRNLDRLNKNLLKNSTKYLTVGHYKFSFDRLNRDYDYDREFPERILIFQAHTGAVIHMMTSKTSVYRKFLTEDLRMNANTMFGCLYHSLIVYRLSALIERTSMSITSDSQHQKQLGHNPQQLLQILMSTNFYPIGIQVRTGDWGIRFDKLMNFIKIFNNEDSVLKSFRYFLTCAQDIVDGNQTLLANPKQVPIIFLISDNARLRRAALRRWKLTSDCIQPVGNECQYKSHDLPVIADSNLILHIAFTSDRLLGLNLAMFDIFLFGFCEQHVISAESGFGSLGVYSALKQRNVYSLSTLKKASCTGKNQVISLVNLNYVWSGI